MGGDRHPDGVETYSATPEDLATYTQARGGSRGISGSCPGGWATEPFISTRSITARWCVRRTGHTVRSIATFGQVHCRRIGLQRPRTMAAYERVEAAGVRCAHPNL